MIKAVLFDLDGTLLPMDREKFTRAYFALLSKKLAPLGYDPKTLVKCVWAGTEAMVKNNGEMTNEERFWEKFSSLLGEKVLGDKGVFDDYYANEFNLAKESCGFSADARRCVLRAGELGYRVALATNPIFPAIATESRIKWSGCMPEDFEIYTTYENSCCCKPNPIYYEFVADKMGLKPSECLMVGNDASEDLSAAETGMSVFLVTDCLINDENKDISQCPQGRLCDVPAYFEAIREKR